MSGEALSKEKQLFQSPNSTKRIIIMIGAILLAVLLLFISAFTIFQLTNFSIVLPEKIELCEGQIITISPEFEPKPLFSPRLQWSTSDSDIIRVNSDGAVTALDTGETVITVYSPFADSYAQCKVTVHKALTQITCQWKENCGIFSFGCPVSTDGLSVTAHYSDDSFADVTSLCSVSLPDNPTLGEHTVNISYTERGISASSALTLLVIEPTLTFTQDSIDVGYMCYHDLAIDIYPIGTEVKWSVSDESIAEITEDGRLYGKSVGTCTLTASVADTYTAQCTVNVKKVVYITIDDGPSVYTTNILRVLDKYNVKATFFVIGRPARAQYYKDIVNGGHVIALHSYTHDYNKCYASADAFMDECYRLQDLIEDSTGIRPMLVRFPGGTGNTMATLEVMQNIIERLDKEGFMYCDWTLASGDANSAVCTADEVYQNVVYTCYDDREIVLMHDKAITGEALNKIIPVLLNRGYMFMTITDDTVPVHTSVYANRR